MYVLFRYMHYEREECPTETTNVYLPDTNSACEADGMFRKLMKNTDSPAGTVSTVLPRWEPKGSPVYFLYRQISRKYTNGFAFQREGRGVTSPRHKKTAILRPVRATSAIMKRFETNFRSKTGEEQLRPLSYT